MKEFFRLLFHFDSKKLFIEPTTNAFVQFFRFSFVGIVATLFDYGTTAVVRELLGAGNVLSTACGFVIGLAVNYMLSTFWVFNSKNTNRIKEFTVFAIIGVVGLLLNTSIIYLFGKMLNLDVIVSIIWVKIRLFYLIRVVATLITYIWNFTARKYILYNKK